MRSLEPSRIHARSAGAPGDGKLRIAQVAPPIEPVPPPGYGGTERVVGDLVAELVARGHDVTLFASGDSTAPGRLIPTVPRALRPAGLEVPPWPYIITTLLEVARRAGEFDVIHGHLDWAGLLLPHLTTVPVVLTFHGRLDVPVADAALAHPPRGLVAISDAQAAAHDIPWEAVVRNGLDLSHAPFERRHGDGLCFVGRIVPEKGPVDAVEIARQSGRTLRIAAKKGWTPIERDYFDNVFKPAMKGADVEFLGELSSPDRDKLMSESYATLMPGSWPEPFGLVAIESLACGTPVIARRVGALPEIIRDGVDGFFGDDVTGMAFHIDHVAELDRAAIRKSVMRRFSASRMADGYEAVYRKMIADSAAGAPAGGLGRARAG